MPTNVIRSSTPLAPLFITLMSIVLTEIIAPPYISQTEDRSQCQWEWESPRNVQFGS
jgi:hypothetical protein